MHSICEKSSWNSLDVNVEEEMFTVYMFHDFSGLSLHKSKKDFFHFTKGQMKENFEQEFDLARDRPGAVRF